MTNDDIRHTEPLLTARDVADRLNVSTETVLRWVRSGDVPAFKLPGGAIRFRASDVDSWLEKHSTKRGDA
jgi:excisionase family DNA binding protein